MEENKRTETMIAQTSREEVEELKNFTNTLDLYEKKNGDMQCWFKTVLKGLREGDCEQGNRFRIGSQWQRRKALSLFFSESSYLSD